MGLMCWVSFQVLGYVGFGSRRKMTDIEGQKIEHSIAPGVPLDDVQIAGETTKTTAVFVPLAAVFFGRDHGF